MAEKQTFETVLEKHENMEATGITIPFDVEKVFGAKRVPVKVQINGAQHQSTIIRMGGKYMVGVPKIFREAANIKAGETITVTGKRNKTRIVPLLPQVRDAIDAYVAVSPWPSARANAIAAGYTDNGAPGERPQYHPGYYGAFVLDPDGNNVELVEHNR